VFGRPLRRVASCESTQLLLGPDDPEGAVAVADFQTAGRGRLGRAWTAPPGTALLCSVLLRPPAGSRIAQLSLVGGLAAAQTVEAALQRPAQLKWPNDVLVDGRKVAGVLAEARDGVVVVGVGLNVNQTAAELPAEARIQAASLRSLDGAERDRDTLLAALLERLETAYRAWLDGGLAPLLHAEIASRDALTGRDVSIDGRGARALGIDAEGRLLLDSGPVESGEVTLVP
jgi:BirA family transcriptional regulator, biotin operon repressor / biotin---[acetyl-CoA-carboxylase] ligase